MRDRGALANAKAFAETSPREPPSSSARAISISRIGRRKVGTRPRRNLLRQLPHQLWNEAKAARPEAAQALDAGD